MKETVFRNANEVAHGYTEGGAKPISTFFASTSADQSRMPFIPMTGNNQ
jgi:hypothetical protein